MVAGMSGRHAWYLYFGLYKSTGNHLRYAASFAAANNFQVLSRKLARMDRRAMFMAIYADPYSMAAVCCVNCLKCIIPLLCCMLPWQAARTIFLEDFELSFLAQLFEQLFVIFFRVAVTAYGLLVFVSFMAMLWPYWVKFRSLNSWYCLFLYNTWCSDRSEHFGMSSEKAQKDWV